MKLIKKNKQKISKNKKYKISFGLFLCPYCNKIVEKQLSNGKRDKSCGCYSNKLISKKNIIHGEAKKSERTKLYAVWTAMKQRCNDKNNKTYKDYGGRGIKVCNQWKKSYTVFKV